ERYNLTLSAKDFDGNPMDTYAYLWNPATRFAEPIFVSGETTLRLMKGDYSVVSYLDILRTPDTLATVMVGEPTLTLEQDTTVELDARTAEKVSVDVGVKGLEPVFQRLEMKVDDFFVSAMMPVWTDEMWAQPMKVDDA